ncbi:hypothetical protein Y032_0314g2209 [Ancylostoma ceylanicum]|uniref:Uncharacterized protein n=1 Tax=Ancylostoma ceylanicum TaxID=53326 RepID=A0A016S206_9BILA|nr:hypothetical protein Y032_0314g2209 [Ancylostoma ceylanicum]
MEFQNGAQTKPKFQYRAVVKPHVVLSSLSVFDESFCGGYHTPIISPSSLPILNGSICVVRVCRRPKCRVQCDECATVSKRGETPVDGEDGSTVFYKIALAVQNGGNLRRRVNWISFLASNDSGKTPNAKARQRKVYHLRRFARITSLSSSVLSSSNLCLSTPLHAHLYVRANSFHSVTYNQQGKTNHLSDHRR